MPPNAKRPCVLGCFVHQFEVVGNLRQIQKIQTAVPQPHHSPQANLEGTKAATSPEPLNPATSERIGCLGPRLHFTHIAGIFPSLKTTLKKNRGLHPY